MPTPPDSEDLAREALHDWDARFWAPSKTLCEACMPPAIAQELQRIRERALGPTGTSGPCFCSIGTSGPCFCAKCGKPR